MCCYQLLEVDKVLTVWLDETKDFGIVEMENSVLGNVFCPIESNQLLSNSKYSIINYLWYPNYQGARKSIKPFVTGKLSKRNISVLTT